MVTLEEKLQKTELVTEGKNNISAIGLCFNESKLQQNTLKKTPIPPFYLQNSAFSYRRCGFMPVKKMEATLLEFNADISLLSKQQCSSKRSHLGLVLFKEIEHRALSVPKGRKFKKEIL